MWIFLIYLNRVKDTQRLYQNGLILLPVRENQDFHIKMLLLCSHSHNDVPPEPQRTVSIAAVIKINVYIR